MLLLEITHRVKSLHCWFDNDFLDVTAKAQAKKKQTNWTSHFFLILHIKRHYHQSKKAI
jgi:hypothetical protein